IPLEVQRVSELDFQRLRSAGRAGGGSLNLRHLTPPPPARRACSRRVGDDRAGRKLPHLWQGAILWAKAPPRPAPFESLVHGVVRRQPLPSREPEGQRAEAPVALDRGVIAVGRPLRLHAPPTVGILEGVVEGKKQDTLLAGDAGKKVVEP